MGARYSRTSGYTISRRNVARTTVRSAQRRVKLGPTAAKFIGLAVLAVLAIVLLSQSSTNSTSSYKQNQLRQDISQVNQDIERLQLEAKRAQSLQEIQNTALKTQMQPVTGAETVDNGDVAGVSTSKP